MATQRQFEANRRNAQKSTGPITVQGKQASALNALKSGLYAKSEILPWESAEDYGALVQTMYSEHDANSALARHYLDEVISCMWEVRRIRRAQGELQSLAIVNSYKPNMDFPLAVALRNESKLLTTTQWRLDATRRALETARRNLAEVQAADTTRLAQTTVPAEPELVPVNASPETDLPEIGFVPKPPALAPSPSGHVPLTSQKDSSVA